jgi:hypothetical protein
MPTADQPFDTSKFINPSQVGGIESYIINDGPARGVRALCVNTGAGLRYRILVDRGFDIDQAFFNQHSLTCLTHKGPTAPTRALDRGLDWLRGFGGGLLTSCGPFNVGRPCNDNGEDLGLHGPHSNMPASLDSVIQPHPHHGRLDLSMSATIKYGELYGPNVELHRTIRSALGENRIDITDEFINAGNTDVPHAWLLHINFGYPLVDEGSEFCYHADRVEPNDSPGSRERFAKGVDYKRIPAPLQEHLGKGSAVAYLYPKPQDPHGRTTVGIVNPKLQLGVAIHYDPAEFPRCVNWQHFAPREYICALEPANSGVDGRDLDRQRGWLDTLKAGATKTYRYSIEVLAGRENLAPLLSLNKR